MKNSPTITLNGAEPCTLIWNKGAMFRADECGVFTTKGLGFARAAKYVWAMLPDSHRRLFPSPEAVAEVLPPVTTVSPVIDAAIAAAGEDMSAKNVFGSMSGPSPASSSTSPVEKPTENSPGQSSMHSAKPGK